MTNQDIARIRAYLEQHLDTYDREALRQQLLKDGHDPQAVDIAMAQVYSFQSQQTKNDPALTPPESYHLPIAVLLSIGIVALNMLLLWGSLPLASSMLTQPMSFFGLIEPPPYSAVPLSPAIAQETLFFGIVGLGVVLPLLIEGWAARMLRTRNQTVSHGLRWGVIVTLVSLLLFALLFGACLVVLTS
jgi:hypothetical protein